MICIERLLQHSGAAEEASDDDDEHLDDIFDRGDRVPRELFDLTRPLDPAETPVLLDGFLNTLDPEDDNWSNTGSIGPASDGRIKPDVSYWNDSIFTTTTGGYTSGFNGIGRFGAI